MDMVNTSEEHVNELLQAHLVAALPTLNPTKACNIYRLIRILVRSGFFARQKLGDDVQEDGYVLTNASRLLLNDNPLCVTPHLKLALDPIMTVPWHFLGAWFSNNDHNSFETAHGKILWDYCRHDPQLNNLFNEGMSSDSRFANSVLIDKCKGVFEGLNSLVDVGGGTGTLGKAIADEFPRLNCTVFDLPHVVAGRQGSGNLRYVGGDMFEQVPAADAILWKNNGEVNDEAWNLTETQVLFDMLMMALSTGKERQEEEWTKLFVAAGLSDYKFIPILGIRSSIELYP
ncbi:Trans-resveratrol di-O-methyltransferase [Hibiscus syriacus]|uniref:Trans-resveratrol di-O-methyltransferase n=1 Tax=Hibiscus syriacus TaxID=106335 RepID=A0A6A2WJT4_HIBSY|nr:Trans-resveratrol di-O-methyltransferase [Hibiscus syriacus]